MVLQIVVILWFASRHIPRHEVAIHSCPRSASNVLSEEGYDVVLEPVGEKSCEITCCGYPADALHVPTKADALQAHNHHAGSRAHDEDASAHAGTVGEELPEESVACEIAHRTERRYL